MRKSLWRDIVATICLNRERNWASRGMPYRYTDVDKQNMIAAVEVNADRGKFAQIDAVCAVMKRVEEPWEDAWSAELIWQAVICEQMGYP